MTWEDASNNFYVDLVGQSTVVGPDNLVVAQYGLNSTTGIPTGIVGSFGPYGRGIAIGPSGDAHAATLVNFNSGAFVVVGTANGDIITSQFTSNGLLDSTFGNGGVMYQDFGTTSANSNDQGYAVALNTDGSILVCGSTLPPSSQYNEIALADIVDSNQVNIS